MGKRGPKPKTAREKQRSGTLQNHPEKPDAKTNTIDFPRARPEPPDHLDKDARELFDRIADDLHHSGVARKFDGPSLGEYCQAVSDVARFRKKIREDGGDEITKGPNGGAVYSPYYGLLKDARTRVKQFGALFGFAPLHRTRVRLPNADLPDSGGESAPKDNMAEFDQTAK